MNNSSLNSSIRVSNSNSNEVETEADSNEFERIIAQAAAIREIQRNKVLKDQLENIKKEHKVRKKYILTLWDSHRPYMTIGPTWP